MDVIGKLASGEPVYDRFNSHLHEDARKLLPEAFSRIKSNKKEFFLEEIDFKKVIGQTTCVGVRDNDEVLWAKRPKRAGHSKFVKSKQSEQCSALVVVLKKDINNNYYVLITAYIGHIAGPEPWDIYATEESRRYWKYHALIWGSEEVISGTETNKCPWN